MSHQYGLQARMSAAILGVIIILWGVLSLNSQEIDKRAVALHLRMLVFDAHAHDVVLAPGAKENPEAQASLLSLRRGGVGAVFLVLPLGEDDYVDAVTQAARDVEWLRRYLSGKKDLAELATRAADMARIRASGKIAIWLGLESFYGPLAGNISNLKRYYDLGIRMITLAEGGRDRLSDVTVADPGNGSLSAFGRDVVREMNRLGLLIDISHLDDRLQRAVIAASRLPVIASHANARGVVDVRRNIADDVLILLKKNGGALMVDGDSSTLSSRPLSGPDFRAPLSALVDHVDYVRRRIGIEHVGIGSDFAGSGSTSPRGLETAAGFPSLTAALLRRGYSEEEIRRVLGANLLRILEQVEAKAASR